jgi:hypothetical protein
MQDSRAEMTGDKFASGTASLAKTADWIVAASQGSYTGQWWPFPPLS